MPDGRYLMIDLHMHSRYSDDGEYTPSELVEQCTVAEEMEAAFARMGL